MSNSRFSRTQTIFTTDKERAFDSMARFEERPLALKVVKQAPPNHQEKEKILIQASSKIYQHIKQPAEPLDWNPLDTKIGIGL